ncbi:MAG: RNA-guided endonuclease InsQ/TnpB family protein [Candidatus Odinarchaeia archaeon]
MIKSYVIPLQNIPTDLIDAYIKIKRKALEFMLSKVEFTKRKAIFMFPKEDRKALRDQLLSRWRYSKHYVDSTINSVISLVKGWVKLYNRRRAKKKPEITRRTVYIKRTLISYRNGVIKISVEPHRRHLIVDLKRFSWIPKDFDDVGGLLLTENKLITVIKREPKTTKPRGYASFDVNLTNITALVDGEVERYDLKPLYHIHRCYETKRRRLQKLAKRKPKTTKRLLEKYSKREKNRTRDSMQKITTKIAREPHAKQLGAILENLRGIKTRTLNKSRKMNRKLSKWNARQFQFMLSYKLAWISLHVRFVNPAYSSRTCPLCSGSMASYEDRIMKCKDCGLKLNRDVVAVLNLQMRGAWVSPDSSRDPKIELMSEKEELSTNVQLLRNPCKSHLILLACKAQIGR